MIHLILLSAKALYSNLQHHDSHTPHAPHSFSPFRHGETRITDRLGPPEAEKGESKSSSEGEEKPGRTFRARIYLYCSILNVVSLSMYIYNII